MTRPREGATLQKFHGKVGEEFAATVEHSKRQPVHPLHSDVLPGHATNRVSEMPAPTKQTCMSNEEVPAVAGLAASGGGCCSNSRREAACHADHCNGARSQSLTVSDG